MKRKRMPTTVILLFFSWLIAIAGLTYIAANMVIFRLNNIAALINGIIVLLVSLLLAVIIRTFANIGQMIFDLKADTEKTVSSILRENMQKLGQMIFDLKADTEKTVSSILRENMQKQGELNKIVNEAGCSLGKMSQDVYEIKNFFEKVEKRLDLKKAQEKE